MYLLILFPPLWPILIIWVITGGPGRKQSRRDVIQTRRDLRRLTNALVPPKPPPTLGEVLRGLLSLVLIGIIIAFGIAIVRNS